MEFSNYVARRMLYEICNIATPLNSLYEHGYQNLYVWMELYTERFGGVILHNLPSRKSTSVELLSDMVELYTGVFSRVEDMNDMTTLHSMFTISFYMMEKYKEHSAMCSNISYYFELMTRHLDSWNTLASENEM